MPKPFCHCRCKICRVPSGGHCHRIVAALSEVLAMPASQPLAAAA